MLDQRGTVLVDKRDDGGGGRPEVNRGDLRRVLLDSLPDGTIRWGRKVTGARPLGDGRHTLTFADGETVTTSLVVGADGAWSKIRALLSEVVPEYVGTSFVETYLLDADVRHPASAAAVGGGSLFALAPGKGVLAHRETDGALHAYIAISKPVDWLASIDFADPKAAKARIAVELDGWAPELLALLTDGETDASSTTDPRATDRPSLGTRARRDADRGCGALDVAVRRRRREPRDARRRCARQRDRRAWRELDAALAEYEDAMFVRSARAAVESASNQGLLFGDNAPYALAQFFARAP